MQRNAFSVHPENLLLAMAADSNQSIREEAVQQILSARQHTVSVDQRDCTYDNEQDESDDVEVEGYSDDEADGDILADEDYPMDESVRFFKVPQIKFMATAYHRVIDWRKEIVTEPPLTKHLTDDQIRDIANTPLDIPKYPCHTQAVERAIKLVSEASEKVYGLNARDGYIRQVCRSRAVMPVFETKRDFQV